MKKKFTLIELIIVIVVIGILAAMALPKFNGVVRNARLSAMINDKEVLEKTLILYYQKYDKLPLLNENQELIVLNNDISLIKMVQAEEAQNNDMKTIYTTLQETLKYYNDDEENLYRIDIKEINNSLSKKLKYGTKKEDKDFYVYSTKTNSVYYYNTMINGDGEIQHSEFNTKLKKSELVSKKFSYNLSENGTIVNNKPIIELTTNLSELTTDSIIKWEYNFVDEDKEPTKISFILNEIEYDSFDKIPTQLEEAEYTIKLKMQDSKGLWSDEIIKEFNIKKGSAILLEYNSISVGTSHSIKIGDDGNLYAWGRNDVGQLGIGNTINQNEAQQVNLPNEVKPKSIYVKGNVSFVITNDGSLYAWGENSSGQLGLNNTKNQTLPQKVLLPNEEKPISIAIGNFHVMVITEDGNLYSWGLNQMGQLGIGNQNNQKSPQKVLLPKGEKPISIAAGEYISTMVTDFGNVYSWGCNYDELLGIYSSQLIFDKPQKVSLPNNEKAISISLVRENAIVITKNNSIYAWGYNWFGELGLGHTFKVTTPQKLTLPNNENPRFVCVGYDYSMFVSEKGNLYVSGNNGYGQLGTGDNTKCLSLKLVNFPNNEKINYINTGTFFSFVKTENGNIYTWGDNRYNQLYLGDNINRNSPQLVIFSK